MLRKSIAHTILWFLFQLLVEINCQKTSSRPSRRVLHTATLVDNKLYILGGGSLPTFDLDLAVEKEFLYLDVSVAFNTQELVWNNLTYINTVPPHYGAASVKGGEKDNTLFLYGGLSNDILNLVYTFNPQSNSWSTPKISGSSGIRKGFLIGVINNRKMYLWSGARVINGENT